MGSSVWSPQKGVCGMNDKREKEKKKKKKSQEVFGWQHQQQDAGRARCGSGLTRNPDRVSSPTARRTWGASRPSLLPLSGPSILLSLSLSFSLSQGVGTHCERNRKKEKSSRPCHICISSSVQPTKSHKGTHPYVLSSRAGIPFRSTVATGHRRRPHSIHSIPHLQSNQPAAKEPA